MGDLTEMMKQLEIDLDLSWITDKIEENHVEMKEDEIKRMMENWGTREKELLEVIHSNGEHIKKLQRTAGYLDSELEIKEDEINILLEKLTTAEIEKVPGSKIKQLERTVDVLIADLKSKYSEIKRKEENWGTREKELLKVINSDKEEIRKLHRTVDNLDSALEIKEDELGTAEKEVEQLQYQVRFLQELNGSLLKTCVEAQVKNQIDTLSVKFKEEIGGLESRILEISNEVKDVIKCNRIEKDELKQKIATLVEQEKDDGFVWID